MNTTLTAAWFTPEQAEAFVGEAGIAIRFEDRADLTDADLTNADLPSIGGNVEEEKQCESSACPVVLYIGEECPACGR